MKQAVCGLIPNEKGEFVIVSRKDNHLDFGLPGGKVDEGESCEQALIREIKEETGIVVFVLDKVYEAECNGYLCSTFWCIPIEENPQFETQETAIVKWGNLEDVISENSSFRSYNLQLALNILQC